MAQFYGTVEGSRGKGSRIGHKTSGLETVAASWQGAVKTVLYHKNGTDYARVSLIPWQGNGTDRLLYDGPVAGAPIAAVA